MAAAGRCTVRTATADDACALLALMRELAVFEGYSEQFCVTEQDLLTRSLRPGVVRQFEALVAPSDCGRLLGYAVTWLAPFTFDLRPNLMLKELYVAPDARGRGTGQALMAAVVAQAQAAGCARIKVGCLAHQSARQGVLPRRRRPAGRRVGRLDTEVVLT